MPKAKTTAYMMGAGVTKESCKHMYNAGTQANMQAAMLKGIYTIFIHEASKQK